jgi:hypothetical protein
LVNPRRGGLDILATRRPLSSSRQCGLGGQMSELTFHRSRVCPLEGARSQCGSGRGSVATMETDNNDPDPVEGSRFDRVLRIAGTVGFFFAGSFVLGLALPFVLVVLSKGEIDENARFGFAVFGMLAGGVGGVWLYWRWTDPNR